MAAKATKAGQATPAEDAVEKPPAAKAAKKTPRAKAVRPQPAPAESAPGDRADSAEDFVPLNRAERRAKGQSVADEGPQGLNDAAGEEEQDHECRQHDQSDREWQPVADRGEAVDQSGAGPADQGVGGARAGDVPESAWRVRSV